MNVVTLRHPEITPAPRLSPIPQACRRRPAALRLLQRIAFWRERMRQRRELAMLDWRTLRDIGVTPEEARREASKPFWR